MGKLGDLIVRLKLQYKDYEKGLKEAEKHSKGFGAKLGKVFSGAKLGLAAIATAAVAMGQQLIQSVNKIGDEWAAMVGGMKGAWDSVLADIANFKPDTSSFKAFFKSTGDWMKNTFFNAKEAGKAAMEMTKAFDAEFELENSLRIKRAQIQGELADLQVELMNTNLSPEARLAAAERYKALLSPLYEAEINTRKNMLDAAVKAWLAGSGVNASVAEVTDFFANYGLDAAGAAAKSPELARIYETRKGDKANQVIFDAITKLAEAESGLADELKRVNKSVNTIKGQLEETATIVRDFESLPALSNLTTGATQMTIPDIIPDDWLERNREKIDAALAEAQRLQGITDQINQQLNDAVVASLSGATQALADCIMGIEGADASQVLAALMQPFAQTAINLGEMLLATGLGITAFKESLKTLQGPVAIAAGLGLIALGSAMASGIRALGGASSASASAGGYDSASSSGSRGIETYEQEITVHVVGEIAGDKIVLAGQKTLNKWNR
jgi:hypothetical protein